MALLKEIRAAALISIMGIRYRAAMSLSTIVGIALVVLVLLGFLSMAHGFGSVLTGSGSPHVAVLLSRGATSEQASRIPASEYRLLGDLSFLPDAKADETISPELFEAVGALRRDGTDGALTLRGLGTGGALLRENLRLTEGRWFTPGSAEITVGRSVQQTFAGFEVGKEIRAAGTTWKVVGVFDSPGTVWGSEIWADLRVVQGLRDQGNSVQSIRIELTDPNHIERLKAAVERDPRLKLSVRSEQEYFRSQSKGMVGLIESLGWPLGLAMAIGALAGALNTMYSSVSSRGAEIATLRTLGFGGLSTFAATMLEALVLAAAGAALGTILAVLIFNNISTSTMGAAMTQVAFDFRVSRPMIVQAWVLSLAVGLVGGALPALRAVRRPILAGLSTES